MHGSLSVKNWKMKLIGLPSEEFSSGDENYGVVVDGITRDCGNGVPVQKNFRGALNSILHYPRPSPARNVAMLVGDVLTEAVVSQAWSGLSVKSMRRAFIDANFAASWYNGEHFPVPDYLVDDLAGCVASAFVRDDERVVWGSICDCGVAVFDQDGELKFATESEGPDKFSKHFWKAEGMQGLSWADAEARARIRRDFRNNPHNEHAYGALTGEEESIFYVRAGELESQPSDIVVAYSDGLENVVRSGQFVDALRKGQPGKVYDLCKRVVRTEGSVSYSAPKVVEAAIDFQGNSFEDELDQSLLAVEL